jgi:hypothetical protein
MPGEDGLKPHGVEHAGFHKWSAMAAMVSLMFTCSILNQPPFGGELSDERDGSFRGFRR